jgi:phospholipid-translocating ATPase
MASNGNDVPEEPTQTTTKRLRWATQRRPGKSGSRKRVSIMDRLHHKGSTGSEKKRESGISSDMGRISEDPNEDAKDEEDTDTVNTVVSAPRKIFFNSPLPPEMLDENGHPSTHFARNKIRTAKYTPLSFLPKNIWLQFHNIANVYFLILIILAVCMTRRDETRETDNTFSSSLCLELRIRV